MFIMLALVDPGGARSIMFERVVPGICMALDRALPGGSIIEAMPADAIGFCTNVGSGISWALPVLTGEVLARLYIAVWFAVPLPTENASPPLLNGPRGARLCPESRTSPHVVDVFGTELRGADSYIVSRGSWDVVVFPVAQGMSAGCTGGSGMALVEDRALAVIGID